MYLCHTYKNFKENLLIWEWNENVKANKIAHRYRTARWSFINIAKANDSRAKCF